MKTSENRRRIILAVIAGVGFGLYLLLAALIENHFKILAGRTYNSTPLFVADILIYLFAAGVLRAALAYTRRREFRGGLYIDWAAVAACLIIAAFGVVFWFDHSLINILFSPIYVIALFFIISCCVRRARSEE